jgi:protein SCO1/2
MTTKTEPATSPPAAAGPQHTDRIRLVALLVAIGGVLLLAITAVALLNDDVTTGAGDDPADAWGGALMAPGQPRPDFTLTDTSGRPYSFLDETSGELTLLFFGYTNCPDICPVQMAVLADALDTPGVPPANVVFVTTDPDRDSAERLRHWLDQFAGGEAFVGLRGTAEQIAAAEEAADVPLSNPLPGDASDYEVGHAAQIMAYTPDDKAHLAYPSGVRSEDWIADLPRMMERWGSDSPPAAEAAAPEEDDAAPAGGSAHVGDITISDAFAAASGDRTAVYLTIDNAGDDDTLVGVSSPDAGDVTLMSGEDGAGMAEVDSVDVPGGSTTAFATGGGHIMVSLDDELEAGDTLPLELELAKAGSVTVDVEVLSWDAVVDRIESSAPGGSSESDGSSGS